MTTKFTFDGSPRDLRLVGVSLGIVLIAALWFAAEQALSLKELYGIAAGFLILIAVAALYGFSRRVAIDIEARRIQITRIWFGLRVHTILDTRFDDCEAIHIWHSGALTGPNDVRRLPTTKAVLLLKSGRRSSMPVFHDGDAWIVAQKLAAGLGELTGLPLVFDPPELADPAYRPIAEPFWSRRTK